MSAPSCKVRGLTPQLTAVLGNSAEGIEAILYFTHLY